MGCGQGGVAGGPAAGGRRVYVDVRTFSCTHTHACCSSAALGSPARAPSGRGACAGRGPLTRVAVLCPLCVLPELMWWTWPASPRKRPFLRLTEASGEHSLPRLRLPCGTSPRPGGHMAAPRRRPRGDWRVLGLLSPQPEHTRGPGGCLCWQENRRGARCRVCVARDPESAGRTQTGPGYFSQGSKRGSLPRGQGTVR